MESKSIARGVRMSPKKVRRVLELIRDKKVEDALKVLKFIPVRPARVVEKVLKSAIANAEHNYSMDVDNLYVSKAFADEGMRLKRFRPVSMGRAHPYRHYTSHITVVVTER